jgi:hypothetical protein
LIHFDPFDYDFHEDPYPIYEVLREKAPLYHNEEAGFWALSRHADVLAGFKDTKRFSNASGVSLEVSGLGDNIELVMSILGMDPPRHGKMRSLVSKGFTPRRVAQLEPSVRTLATTYIDRFVEVGQCDWVADFAGRLPMDVVSEMLGVPESDRDELRGWADLVLHREEGVRGVPQAGIESSGKLLGYFSEMIGARRRAPGTDLASALLEVEVEGERLKDAEILAFCYLMIIAGNETTTKLLANCLYWLDRNPEQRAKIEGHPERIPDWIEETMRYDNSTQLMARTLTEDVEMYGETMPAGDKLLLLIGSANRDEAVFENPERYDLDRATGEHLSFGRGAHFCLGAALARLETRVSLEEATRRLPEWRVDAAGAERVHNPNVRGFSKLPLAFKAS